MPALPLGSTRSRHRAAAGLQDHHHLQLCWEQPPQPLPRLVPAGAVVGHPQVVAAQREAHLGHHQGRSAEEGSGCQRPGLCTRHGGCPCAHHPQAGGGAQQGAGQCLVTPVGTAQGQMPSEELGVDVLQKHRILLVFRSLNPPMVVGPRAPAAAGPTPWGPHPADSCSLLLPTPSPPNSWWAQSRAPSSPATVTPRPHPRKSPTSSTATSGLSTA